MNKDNELYRIVWTQIYQHWEELVEPQSEPELMNLTEAREVLARIMAK